MIPIAMITAPRKANYISLTLESLFDYGYSNVTTFEEPGTLIYQHNTKCTRVRHDTKQGCVRNWLSALEYMNLKHKSPVIICEDDFLVSEPFHLDYLATVYQNWGFISPYCSKVNANVKGWGPPKKANKWCGALFMCLSVPAQEMILDNVDLFLWHAAYKTNEPKHLDYAIGQMLLNFNNYCHNPSLIQHIGTESTFEKNNCIKGLTLAARQPAI